MSFRYNTNQIQLINMKQIYLKKIGTLFKGLAAAILLCFIGSLNASAYDFESDGIYYNTISDSEVEVTSGDQKYSGDITLPETVKYESSVYTVTAIGDYAFFSCDYLTSIDIPNSVIIIGESAFQYCLFLSSVNLGNSVTSIGMQAFSNCSFTSITLPDSLISIGTSAFFSCSKLTSITIPESVTTIDVRAFVSCYSLTEINVNNNNQNFASFDGLLLSKSGTDLLYWPEGKEFKEIPSYLTSIGDYAFYSNENIVSLNMPDSINSIGVCAFGSCESLETLNLGNSVIKINNGAFRDCELLTSVDIPDSVVTMGNGAFSNCTSLTSVNIGESLSDLGKSVFVGCSSLTSINVNENNQVYASVDGIVYSKDITVLLCCPEGKQKVTIPNSVIQIEESAFERCSLLTEINMGNSVNSICNSAFYLCSSLTAIELPESITTIENYAFGNCSALVSVICNAIELPQIQESSFENISSTAILYVPSETIENYKNSDWSQYFSKILPIGEENPEVKVTSIEISPEGDQEMMEGETLVFTAVVTPEDATDATVVWKVDDEEVISIEVDEENPNEVTVTALAAGEAVLTATAKDGSEVYAEVTITVTEGQEPVIYVTSIEILPEEAEEMTVGESLEFTAVVTPENATDATVVWTVDDEDVVDIEVSEEDPNEVTVTALAEGEVVLTAEAADGSGVFATVTITVVEAEPEPAPEVVTKYNITFLYDETGVVAEGATITWQSEGKIEINPDNEASVTATPLSGTLGEEIKATVKDNALVLDFTSLAVGTYSVYIPEGYVLIGENGINEGIGFNIAIEAVTGIAGIQADADGCYNVYKISGEKVVSTKEVSRLKNLESGLYIINGNKIMIRK